MAKKMLIDATHAEETRVVVADGNKVEEFDFESLNKRQLAGNIYLAKVTRVEPSLQAAFVDYGGNRHGFLAFSEIHPDYYQIPTADREALIAEEQEYARAQAEAEAQAEAKPKRSRRRRKKPTTSDTVAAETKADAVTTGEVQSEERATPSSMDVVDLPVEGDAPLLVEPSAATSDESPVVVESQSTEADAPVQDPAPEAAGDAAPDIEELEAETTEVAVAEETAVETTTAEDGTAEVADKSAGEDEAFASESAENVPETSETDAGDIAPAENTNDAPSSEGDDEVATAEQPEEAEAAPVVDEKPKDPSIDIVADDDDQEELRPVRKPRPRRYKIQEVVKVRQIMLVQVVKEERGNKGAALTTYLSLAGRYCVLMPNTARGGGISRKITNAADRKKLKEIATGLDVPQGAGLIIRTAGAKRTKTEIKRDYEYLQRQWEQVRDLTLKSVAPAPIYQEGDLIHRSIRDLYNRDIDEVLVEGDLGYRHAKDFMKMIMPSHAKNVKHYNDPMPLFARHQVEGYLADMFNPVVQLKSGGYIVIGVTEALVAIDVNSGRATKEGSIEETATKTNLEAAEEVARQLRLRDLAGLIVIDFIDMDERKNNAAVEKRIKDKLKTDRARIQVGRISGFGLMEMSRQRLRPGMLEATTQPCHACHGTGLVRSDDSLALSILRQLEEEGTRRKSREVLVTAPVGIVNFIMNSKREYLAAIEARYGMAVRVEADPSLVSPDFKIEKFKTATRRVAAVAPVISMDASLMDAIEAEVTEEEEVVAATTPEAVAEDDQPKKKRRRRRGGRGRRKTEKPADEVTTEGAEGENAEAQTDADTSGEVVTETVTATEETITTEASAEAVTETAEAAPEKPKRKRRSRKKPVKAEVEKETASGDDAVASDGPETSDVAGTEVTDAPAAEAIVTEQSAAADAPVVDAAEPVIEAAPAPEVEEPAAAEAADVEAAEVPAETVEVTSEPEPEPAVAPEPVMAEAEAAPAAEEQKPEEPPKPKKRGWWNIG